MQMPDEFRFSNKVYRGMFKNDKVLVSDLQEKLELLAHNENLHGVYHDDWMPFLEETEALLTKADSYKGAVRKGALKSHRRKVINLIELIEGQMKGNYPQAKPSKR